MTSKLEAATLALKDSNKEAEGLKQPQHAGAKGSKASTQEGAVTRSLRIRGAQTVKRVGSFKESQRNTGKWSIAWLGENKPSADFAKSRTPSPGTISKRKRGVRGSLLSTAGSLPLGGAWITAASLQDEADNAQEEQQLESGGSSLVLDPVEHAWMIMVAEGNYDELQASLQEDPSLLYQRDFVTGYSIIHWLAKHGHHEDLIRLMDFAGAGGYPLDVNARASGGLTPLHIAALQGHGMLIKVLVGAYNADIHIRDHNGRKAWQYLRPDTPGQLRELSGAPEDDPTAVMNVNNNCHPSNSHIMAQGGCDEMDSTSKVTARPATLRKLFKQARRYFKIW
ncbi:ankyrin repeat domain-containing protein SOWAHD [Ascaphus truei]|uniref:ankyrin repeat domain-containing protein SOWAHD n=1 Tax=Ascaphus truei TaxID=8439 RepID=UPI003F59DDE5